MAYRNRFLQNRLPQGEGVILITGATQMGKTTMAKNLYPSLNYINLGIPGILEKVQEVPAHSWVKNIGAAIVDELQVDPSVLEKIKYCLEDKSLQSSVLLGVSHLLATQVRDALAEKVALYELFPFMVSEIIEQQSLKPPLLELLLQSTSLDQLLWQTPAVLSEEEKQKKQEAFKYLLTWGGMPALLTLPSDEEKKKWLNIWLKDHEYIYVEMGLVDLELFRKFRALVALQNGQLLTFSDLAQGASISKDTAECYFEYLKGCYQTFSLQQFSINHASKLYWLDMGVLRQTTNNWAEATDTLFETMVIAEVYKWVRTNGKDVSLFFYQGSGGLECALLLQTPQGFIGIEIKMRKKVYPEDLSSLAEIAKQFPGKWLGSLVIYDGDAIEKLSGDKAWAIPAWRLLS